MHISSRTLTVNDTSLDMANVCIIDSSVWCTKSHIIKKGVLIFSEKCTVQTLCVVIWVFSLVIADSCWLLSKLETLSGMTYFMTQHCPAVGLHVLSPLSSWTAIKQFTANIYTSTTRCQMHVACNILGLAISFKEQ